MLNFSNVTGLRWKNRPCRNTMAREHDPGDRMTERLPRRVPRATLIGAAALCPLLVSGASIDGFPDQVARAPQPFVRAPDYPENPQFARGWGGYRWMTDAPEAETHLLQGIRRLTRINAASEGTAVRLEEMPVDQPFLYAVEVGGWELSDIEVARLREYLDRGGFLVVDDFHGTLEWEGFMHSMRSRLSRPVRWWRFPIRTKCSTSSTISSSGRRSRASTAP